MMFRLDQQIIDPFGKNVVKKFTEPYKDPLTQQVTEIPMEKPVIMQEMIHGALIQGIPGDEKLSYKAKMARGQLAMKVLKHDSKEEIDLDPDEIKLLKDQCGFILQPTYLIQFDAWVNSPCGPSASAKEYMEQKGKVAQFPSAPAASSAAKSEG